GHTYRFYVMVHDGDQNKSGGDAGQAAFNYTYPGPAVVGASIGGFVYADFNFNGVHDATDGALAGMTVTLTGFDNLGNSITLTTTTDVDGRYNFSGVVAGTYSLSVDHGPSMMSTGVNVGTVNGTTNGTVVGETITSIVLKDGDQGLEYNFGEMMLA